MSQHNFFNQVIIMGTLYEEPEVKKTEFLDICTFPIETKETYKKKNGEVKETITRIYVDTFGPLAQTCASMLQIGMPCMIQGRLKYESWKDENGVTKSRHKIIAEEVLFLGEDKPVKQEPKQVLAPQQPYPQRKPQTYY